MSAIEDSRSNAAGPMEADPKLPSTTVMSAKKSDTPEHHGEKNIPPGVAKIQELSQYLTLQFRIAIFVSVFFIGFSYGLASSVTSVYQTYATASYRTHSLLATSNTLRTVFSVAAQPTAAKLADMFGRLQIVSLCATLYIVGLIVQASSTNVSTFVAGVVINQMGLSTTQVLVEVTVADFSSTRARAFCYTIPNLHFIVTIWISGNITASMLSHSSWRWGIGMWTIVYTACMVPFVTTMLLADRHAQKNGATKSTANKKFVWNKFLLQMDAPGLLLLVAGLALVLTPLSLGGGVSSKWKSANIIAPMVVGVLCFPALAVWESYAEYPLAPFSRMRDRSVWGALGLALFFNFAIGLQRGFLYTVLVVAFDFSVISATRTSTILSFVVFTVGPITGLLVYRVRRMRPFIISGVIIFTIAFGLLLRYRGGNATSDKAGIIAGQVLLGLGSGLFAYTASVAMQVSFKHEHVGVMIALFFAVSNIGNACGSSVSGAIWSQVLPKTLIAKLGNPTLARQVFANPFAIVARHPMGTVTRVAIVESYQHVQRLLCATGLGLCVPVIGFAAVIRDRELNDAQTLVEDN